MSDRVAAAGEPFRLFFIPDELHACFHHPGFTRIQDLSARELNARYGLQLFGAVIFSSRTPSRLHRSRLKPQRDSGATSPRSASYSRSLGATGAKPRSHQFCTRSSSSIVTLRLTSL